MIWNSKFNKHLIMLVVPMFLLVGHSVQAAPVTVSMSVSPSGPNYAYDFAITNLSSTDPYGNLISVDFNLPGGSLVGLPTAPAGNGVNIDLSSPSVDFVEFVSNNLSGFAVGTAVDGFQFVNSTKFATLPFIANYLDAATQSSITTYNGTTQTPTVPEPATLGLFGAASLLLFSRMRKLLKA